MPDPRLKDNDTPAVRIESFTDSRSSRGETPYSRDDPLPEKRKSRLLSESLKDKTGNYVFTFGYPGSGKTTFHSFLIRYLMEEGPFKTEFVTKNDFGDVDYDITRMITKWKSEWREGRFPERTPVGQEHIRELRFDVRPLKGVRTPLEFNILEISGEMLKEVTPSEHKDPALTRILLELLSNEKINFIILLLLNPAVYDNDELFVNFLSFLDANLPYNIRERSSLGIIVSKPDDALTTLKKMRSGYDHVADLRGDYIEDFVESFAKSTYRIWYDWPNPKRKMISRMYLGEIGDHNGEMRLLHPHYQSVNNIFDWIYSQFTGKKLGPTFWQKIISNFKS